jgi:homocysteine S-methyltransferase
VDAIGLTNLVANLNRGLDPGGNTIGAPTRFVVGVGVNPAAVDPAHERDALPLQGRGGAEYAITQPVFDARSSSASSTRWTASSATARRR